MAGGILYNVFNSESARSPRCYLSMRKTILNNQTPAYRKYISELNKGRVNVNRKAIVAEGNVYLSILEAATCFNVQTLVIRRKINSGMYREATPLEIQNEVARRASSLPSEGQPVVVNYKKRSTGCAKPVRIKEITYNSVTEAAENLSVTPAAISKAIKAGRSGYSFVEDGE
jgi:uncharacterized protein (DUF885 family)